MGPRPRGRGDGLGRGGVHVAVGPVQQAGQRRPRQLVRRAHQVQVRAQQHRRRVREEGAAQRRRPRHVAGVQRERDQQLLRAVAAEHGQVAPAAAEARLLGAQEGAHGRGALRPGRRAEEPDRAVLRAGARPDVLGLAHDVVGDEARTGLHDGARAAVVGAQGVRGRPRLGRHAPVELEDAARVGLPPAVDELVVVADDEQPPVWPREHVHERELRAVQVLELVHQHVFEARLDEGPVSRVLQHVGDGEVDLIVERLQTGRRLRAGVLRVDGRERQAEQRGLTEGLDLHLHLGRRFERGAYARETLHERADRVAAAARLEVPQRDAGRLHGARHEGAQRAAVVVEREACPQHLALIAVAEGVERGAVDPGGALGDGAGRWSAGRSGGAAADGAATSRGVVRGRAEAARAADAQRRQPLLELFGRLAVEGEHEDAGRVRAAVHELDHAAHQRLGLARACRGEHPRRAAGMHDGGALGVVEPDRVRAARGPATWRGCRRRG